MVQNGEISKETAKGPLIKAAQKSITITRHYECEVCHKFYSSRKFTTHVRSHFAERPFKCEFCPKSFVYKGELDNHRRTHTGERPFVCAVCKKGFTSSSHLAAHRKIHNTEKTFQCGVCSKKFLLRDHLTRHNKIHIGDRKFKCDFCGKGFILKSGLSVHIRTHTDEKPFKCEVCSKTFRQKGQLDSHSRQHTGERPFACSLCGKTFMHRAGRAKHFLKHTGEKPFQCNLCYATFGTKPGQVKHMRRHEELGDFCKKEIPEDKETLEDSDTILPLSVVENILNEDNASSVFIQPSQIKQMKRHEELNDFYKKEKIPGDKETIEDNETMEDNDITLPLRIVENILNEDNASSIFIQQTSDKEGVATTMLIQSKVEEM